VDLPSFQGCRIQHWVRHRRTHPLQQPNRAGRDVAIFDCSLIPGCFCFSRKSPGKLGFIGFQHELCALGARKRAKAKTSCQVKSRKECLNKSENGQSEESKTPGSFHENARTNKYAHVYTGSQVALQEKSAVPEKKCLRTVHFFFVHEHENRGAWEMDQLVEAKGFGGPGHMYVPSDGVQYLVGPSWKVCRSR
jgi:hypothetical protein